MLQLHSSAVRRFGGELHLDLAGLRGIGFDLPRRADIPCEDDPIGRIAHQHARPPALTAVDAAVVDGSSCPRLENRLGDGYRQQVVLTGFDVVESAREQRECDVD